MAVEKQSEKTPDLGKTLESISGTEEAKDPNKRWLKIALAGFINDIPNNKRAKPDVNDLRWGMNARIDADIKKDPEVAKNPDVQKVQTEIESRLALISDPKKLLEAYAQMRGMLEGAVGAEQGSESKWLRDLQRIQIDQKASNDLASLDFVQLWEKFRDAITNSQKESSKRAQMAIIEARAASYTEAKSSQQVAGREMAEKLGFAV